MLIIGNVWLGYFFFQCFWTPLFRFAFDITRQLRKRGGVAGLTLLHLKVSAPVQVSKDNSTEKETINVLICMLRAALRQLLGNLCIHFIHTPSCLSGKRNGAPLCAVFKLHVRAPPSQNCRGLCRPLVDACRIASVGHFKCFTCRV